PPTIIEPNGIDLAEFDGADGIESLKDQLQLTGKFVVLFMGRLHYKKGLDLLIPAFARAGIPDSVLLIAGPDDGYLRQAKKLVAENNLADRVKFTGMLQGEQRISTLANADLFVLPSYQENFGIVAIEALAAGTPVIVSDQVNLWPEIVAAGVGAV